MEKGKELSVIIHSSHNLLKVRRKQGKCQNAKVNLIPQHRDPRKITPMNKIQTQQTIK